MYVPLSLLPSMILVGQVDHLQFIGPGKRPIDMIVIDQRQVTLRILDVKLVQDPVPLDNRRSELLKGLIVLSILLDVLDHFDHLFRKCDDLDL
jgi:hypothetical protein